MEPETFKPWEPVENMPRRLEVVGLRDEEEGLVVLVVPERSRLPIARLVFRDVVAYRNINESFRHRTWSSHEMADLPSLLIVEGSSWVRWLSEESGGILDELSVTHYAIYTNDDCIDVAAKTAPVVSVP